MTISLLDLDREKALLEALNLSVDSWGRVINNCDGGDFYVKLRAPQIALELHCCALWIIQWIGFENHWLALNFDGSNSMSFEERFILGTLSNAALKEELENGNPGLLFDFRTENSCSYELYINIASILFHCLMFESHCWLTASNGKNGRRLAIQDGYIYFFSNVESELESANIIIEQIQNNPLKLPDWLVTNVSVT